MMRNKFFFHTKLRYNENIWNPLNYLPFNKKEAPVWTSATNTKNYLINDPLLDWLELYYCKLGHNIKGEKLNKNKLKK